MKKTTSYIIALLAATALFSTALGQNIDNHSFENDPPTDWSNINSQTQFTTYADWMPDGAITSAQDGSRVAFFLGSAAIVGGGGLSGVEQSTGLFVSPNTDYTLDGWFVNPQRGASAYGGEMLRIVARDTGGPGAYVIGMHFLEATSPGTSGPLSWTQRSATVSVGSDTSTLDSLSGINGTIVGTVGEDITGWEIFATVGKSLTGTGNSFGFNAQTYADNISLTAVPEPSFYAFMFGLLAVGMALLKRRKS